MRTPMTFSYKEYKEALQKISELEKQMETMQKAIEKLTLEAEKTTYHSVA